jgi:radical SAM protein with 4Fe4S-binding SPASM domain
MLPIRNLKRFVGKALKQPIYAIRVFEKRMAATFSYYFSAGRSSAPEAITFFLTRLCNLRCRMCGQWGDAGVARTEDIDKIKHWLSLDEIRTVLNEVRVFKPNITLFGGEPLMHPEAMEIIRSVKSSGLHCLIITNGTMLGSFAEGVVEAGLDELNISIDGGQALHDEIRGVPGVFDRIMAGIAEVNIFKRKLSKNKPLINIQCTISKYNYDRLEQLLEVARQANASSLTFHNLIFLGQDLIEKQKPVDALLGCSSKDWQGFVFEPGIDSKVLYQKIDALLSRKYEFDVDFYPNFSLEAMKEYYGNPDYLPSEYAARCISPWVCTYIFPDGEVRPCLNCTFSYGNIKTGNFAKAWNSERAVFYRRTLKKQGLFPACRRCTELYRY